MPQSLDLAAFVFGAVLILLALVAGSFKLFGAEVQGTTGRLGRIVAFALGLILIVSRLAPRSPDVIAGDRSPGAAQAHPGGMPTPATEATVLPAPAPAPVAPPDDDDPAPRRRERAADVSLTQLLVGTWQAEYSLPDDRTKAKLKTKVRYDRNGTFSGVETMVSDGLTNQVPMQGTWRVHPLSTTRFELTTKDKQLREPEVYNYRVVDHDHFENEDLGFVVRRVANE
jgi:hypothetical protein